MRHITGGERADSRPPGTNSSRMVVSVRVDATSYADAVCRVKQWVHERSSRYVCACNVHMVMEAYDDPEFQETVNGADLVTPDGMPLVWALRLMGIRTAARVYGPRLMLELCHVAESDKIGIGLYGSTDRVLARLEVALMQRFPGLNIAFSQSPAFGSALSLRHDAQKIRESGAGILFVGLGCPKQERWMSLQVGQIHATMVGVGAAFEFIAGTKPQAPRWLQKFGLEWTFRLFNEPARLWRRYALNNPRYVALLIRQLIRRPGDRQYNS